MEFGRRTIERLALQLRCHSARSRPIFCFAFAPPNASVRAVEEPPFDVAFKGGVSGMDAMSIFISFRASLTLGALRVTFSSASARRYGFRP